MAPALFAALDCSRRDTQQGGQLGLAQPQLRPDGLQIKEAFQLSHGFHPFTIMVLDFLWPRVILLLAYPTRFVSLRGSVTRRALLVNSTLAGEVVAKLIAGASLPRYVSIFVTPN